MKNECDLTYTQFFNKQTMINFLTCPITIASTERFLKAHQLRNSNIKWLKTPLLVGEVLRN